MPTTEYHTDSGVYYSRIKNEKYPIPFSYVRRNVLTGAQFPETVYLRHEGTGRLLLSRWNSYGDNREGGRLWEYYAA